MQSWKKKRIRNILKVEELSAIALRDRDRVNINQDGSNIERWTIEKAFNNSKSNLKETKAWSPNRHALNSQMRFTAMSYNFMRVFEEISKKHDPDWIHPADKKYTKALEKDNKRPVSWTVLSIPCYSSRVLRV